MSNPYQTIAKTGPEFMYYIILEKKSQFLILNNAILKVPYQLLKT